MRDIHKNKQFRVKWPHQYEIKLFLQIFTTPFFMCIVFKNVVH